MFKCKVCSRKFKSRAALGGHMSTAHQRKQGQENTNPDSQEKDIASATATEQGAEKPVSEVPAQAQDVASVAAPREQASEAEQIQGYLKQGYSFELLTSKFGFKPTTVRQEMAKLIPPDQKVKEEQEQDESGLLPIVLKDGKGEILSPEAVYYKLVASDGINGERDFRALMKWAASIEMVQRMTQIRKGEAEAVAETIKPMLDMMERSRQELDAAAARAKESSMAIAEAAAMGAAGGVLGRIDAKFEELKQQKQDIATVQDPMKGLMARTMETMMNRVTGMMVGGQVGPTPGLVDKRAQK